MTIDVRPMSSDVLASLDAAYQDWDRTAAAQRARAAEESRLEFVSRFPLDEWPTMPLERYALGQQIDGGSACWWLEFNTKNVASMSGGSSSKHLIFKGSDGQWRFPKQYATVEQAWEAVRAGFVEAFRLAEVDQMDDIYNIEALYGAPALRTKALYMYFPDKFIPVCSFLHLHHFLDQLSQRYDANWLLGTNVLLLNTLRTVPFLQGLSTHELMTFAYHWADPRATPRLFKIAPGEQGRLWNDCLTGKFICVGWDEVGDLTNFRSKEDFKRAFADSYATEYNHNESTISRKANELWTLTTLEPGDLILANRGISEILAVGTVTDTGYEYRPDRAEYRHTVGVDWDLSAQKAIEPIGAWRTTTVSRVTAAVHRRLFSQQSPQPDVLAAIPVAVDDPYTTIEQAVKARGQVILYGPPGTGKTYVARRAAMWIAAGGSANPTAAQLLDDGPLVLEQETALATPQRRWQRVWFVVASPSTWSSEQRFRIDSIDQRYDGLQPNFAELSPGDLVVVYEASPTERIVALATVTQGHTAEVNTEQGFDLAPLVRIDNGIDSATLHSDPVLRHSEPAMHQCQGTLFALSSAEADRLLGMLTESNPTVDELMKPAPARLTRVTFHPSYTYEDFIEGFRPSPNGSGTLDLRLADGVFKRVCLAAAANPDVPYVVLIDEINRGNIAKIFGELITLIEHDKRGMSVTLPQSGHSFSIPPNVVLIGTMNTADRSIQLLDTALRRRFRFIELMPDSTTLEGVAIAGLGLAEFLDGLNDAIRNHVGRERQIGHAVFFQHGEVITSPEAFVDVFHHEVLPLVQEYLYDNYADLERVFGPGIIDAERAQLRDGLDDPITLCALLSEQFGLAAS